MRPVSALFLEALRGSHNAVTEVTLCSPPGQTGVTPTGRKLAVVDGTVVLDGDAAVRGTLDLTLAERFGDPKSASLATELLPYGAELFVTRGIEVAGRRFERVPLGYFRIAAVEQGEAPAGSIRVTGFDRMKGIEEDRPVGLLSASGSATYGAVLAAVVQDTYPGAVIEWPDGGDTDVLGRRLISTDSRIEFVQTLVESTGRIAYWDHRGRLVVKLAPPPGVPVWRANAGRDGTLVSLAREVTREGVYNVVVVRGQGPDQTLPVQGIAVDGNPASPTYWAGPFGRVVRFFESNLITTTQQATDTATRLLANSNGLPYSVSFGTVPNPALEPFDPIEVVYPVDREAVPNVNREIHVVSKLAIPLGFTNPMVAETRMVSL